MMEKPRRRLTLEEARALIFHFIPTDSLWAEVAAQLRKDADTRRQVAKRPLVSTPPEE